MEVPRDEESDTSGCGFWAWAERVMDEHAERKSELEIRFANEEGTGIGPTLEFYRLLAEELRRRSVGMWLMGDSDGEFINPSFGLFPAPYPREVVPLSVLRRFYIMGIAVGKALQVSCVQVMLQHKQVNCLSDGCSNEVIVLRCQDNRLMDLPLSRPFLKLLACFGSSRHLQIGAGHTESLEEELHMVGDAEARRERLFCGYADPLFTEHGRRSRMSGSGGGHWLTGMLAFEDFAVIQPERGNLFRQLLSVHAAHKSIREAHALRGDFSLEERLNEASVEILTCTVEDLSLNMEFVAQSSIEVGQMESSSSYSVVMNARDFGAS